MTTEGKAARYAAISALGFLFLVNVYRAATQSMTHDEAYTYQLYIAAPVSQIFQYFNPNNHFFAVLLMKLTTVVFGINEFTMRLPSVVSGGFYFYLVYRICLLAFGEGYLFLISVLLLSTNPFLLDFHVAARGYGIGITCLVWAIYSLMLYSTERRGDWRLQIAGMTGLSLAVASNPTFLFPAGMIAVLFVVTLPPLPAPSKKEKRRKPVPASPITARLTELKPFVVTVAALALLFLISSPFNKVRARGLYRPVRSLALSAVSVLTPSLAHNEGLGGLNRPVMSSPETVKAFAVVIFPVIVIAGLFFGWKSRLKSPLGLLLLWTSGTVVGSVALHVIGGPLLHLPYPGDRTGIYFLPFIAFVLPALAGVLRGMNSAARHAAVPLAVLSVLLVAQQVIQFNWTHFQVWPYDADDRKIVDVLNQLRGQRKTLSVGLSWQLEPSFNFYRETRKITWLRKFDRSGLEGDYEYYVIIPQNRDVIAERNLKPIYEGPVSGTILAVRQGSQTGPGRS